MNLFFGSILTILVTAVVAAIIFFIGGSSVMSRTDIMLIGGMVAGAVASVFVILWAIPAYFLFKKYNINLAKWYVLAGFITGPIFVFGFSPFGEDSFEYKLYQAAVCGAVGVVGALVFWFYVVKLPMHNKSLSSDK